MEDNFSGFNSKGNYYQTAGGTNSNTGSSFYYSNSNGSYYYKNDNGSSYYRDSYGNSSYTAPRYRQSYNNYTSGTYYSKKY